MSEDERTVERTGGGGETDGSAPTSDGPATGRDVGTDASSGTEDGSPPTPDDAAESFLELDADLAVAPDDDATGYPRRGLVVDAERVDRSAVPEGYPLAARTDRAVALTVDFGDGTTTVYLAWPDDAEGEVPLTWLLDAMGIELRDLYGREVAVERVDGHDALLTPDERPRGSDRSVGLVGGLAVVAGAVGLLAVTGGLPPALVLLWAGVTLAWLPYATYEDAWYLRTHSDWDGGPAFWATLAALPFLNLLTCSAYLWARERARFFGRTESLRTRISRFLDSIG